MNTCGTIIAALCTGLVLLPTVGTQHTIFVGMAINTIIIIILLKDLETSRIIRLGIAIVAVGGSVGLCIWVPQTDSKLYLTSEFRHQDNRRYTSFAHYRDTIAKQFKVLFFKEGITSSVMVAEEAKESNRVLYINGKADASTSIDADLITQTLLGLIPIVP